MPRIPLISSANLTGVEVKNAQGERLGTMEDFMLDLGAGRVVYAVLSFGALPVIQDKLYAVPLSALQLDAGDRYFILDVDKEQLKHAPGFDRDNWPDMADPDWERHVREYYAISSNRFVGSRMKH